jgi:hypothetical protein
MTEDLIVVEGNLRLPTLRALTDPSLQFGREWSPVQTRPVQSDSERALCAARFQTAYVPAFALPGANASYGGASIWGVFGELEIPRAMLRLKEGVTIPKNGGVDRAAPIHLNVVKPALDRAHTRYVGKPAAAAIAVACTVLIAWFLFAHEPHAPGNAPVTHVAVQALEPEAKAPPVLPESAAAAVIAIPTVIAEAQQPPASTHTIADTPPRKGNGRVRTVLTSHAQPGASRASSASSAGKRVAKRDTKTRVRAISARTRGGPASAVARSMKPAALYAMLQHSPTLDSNARDASGPGGGRTQNAR